MISFCNFRPVLSTKGKSATIVKLKKQLCGDKLLTGRLQFAMPVDSTTICIMWVFFCYFVNNTLIAAVDNEPVLEVTQPCNDQKTFMTGITKSSNLPVRCIQFTTIWICHSLHIMLPFLKTGINYWHFWFQYGWNVNCKYHMLLQTTPVSVDPYP